MGGIFHMSRKDEFNDFRTQMQKLKMERERERMDHLNPNNAQDQTVIDRVVSAITPVLKAFVDTDRFLEIQSSDFRNFYITYANIKICVISVSAANLDNINIEAVFNSISTRIYSESYNEKEIKNVVKNVLLNWYRSL